MSLLRVSRSENASPGKGLTFMMDRTVLVTGAAGVVGSLIVPPLLQRYRLRLLDVRTLESALVPGNVEQIVADLRDEADVMAAVRGVDTIVHLAGNADPTATWDALAGSNVEATQKLWHAARMEGIRRLVFASSNHVTGMYDLDGQRPVSPHWPARPCCLYGVTKHFGETIARFYSDRFGLSTICLRLGWVLLKPHNRRARRQWLSPNDLVGYVTAAIEIDRQYGLYYAVSANTNRDWDTSNVSELAYRPVDNAEVYASQMVSDSSDELPACQR